jgi:hypothetical protein
VTPPLPFLAGTAALVERLAQQHHEHVTDPAVIAIRPELKGEPSWAAIRNAGLAALQKAGAEIKNAKTQTEVAAAQLRWTTYHKGLEDIEAALLKIAAKKLSDGPIPDFDRGELTGLVSYGRRSIGGALELIPPAHWEAGAIDWSKWHLSVHDGSNWFGVRILDLADLPPDQVVVVTDELLGSEVEDAEEAVETPEAAEAEVAAVEADMPSNLPEQQRNVSGADLSKFLVEHVSKLPPGDPGLTEKSLLHAAKEQFESKKVPRQQLRSWMREHMAVEKRYKRGYSPKSP